MYLRHFALTRFPFHDNPDTRAARAPPPVRH